MIAPQVLHGGYRLAIGRSISFHRESGCHGAACIGNRPCSAGGSRSMSWRALRIRPCILAGCCAGRSSGRPSAGTLRADSTTPNIGGMKYKDYYKILGVERGASDEDIKKAYRKLARRYHPDVSKEANAKERFQEVSEAYETLRDKEKRAAYDSLGSFRPGQDFRPPPDWFERFGSGNEDLHGVDLGELFESMGLFGRAGRSRSRGVFPGEDYEVPVRLTLEEAFRGTERTVQLDARSFT